MRSVKNIFKGVVLAVILAGTLPACRKVLDQAPNNSPYDQVYWQSAADCNSAIAGNYALLRTALTATNNSYYMYGDGVAQNYFTIQWNGDALENIQSGNFSPAYVVNSLGNWTRFYKVVAMSNLILKKVPQISDNLLYKDVSDVTTFRNKILGQAYFIRAYSYFMMARVWNEVPVDTTSYDNPINAPQLPRSSQQTVLKQIEDDCHKAISLLQWGYETETEKAVTANRSAAYALLSHLYLWRATMTNLNSNSPVMSDVNSADTSINTLLLNGGYALTDTTSYARMFTGRSSESIFEINMSEDTREGSSAGIGLNFLPTKYLATAGSNPRFYVVKNYLTDHFGFGGEWVWNEPAWAWVWNPYYDSTDVRFNKIFTNVGEEHPVCLKYSNVVYRSANKTNPYLSNNMILFRLSDVQLLKAEIALYKGDAASAATIINNFRQLRGSQAGNRVELTASAEDVMYEYILERGKEMYLEGHIFWDLLRTRQYETFTSWLTESRFKQGGFYWPIDPALFRDNRYLTQTPYWRSKI